MARGARLHIASSASPSRPATSCIFAPLAIPRSAQRPNRARLSKQGQQLPPFSDSRGLQRPAMLPRPW